MLFSLLRGTMDFDQAIMYLISALTVIFLTLPFHEFAHAFVADRLGDNTPRYQGRLTLNPLAHIDYLGALGVLFLGFGWAKPVQVNARRFKNPKIGMLLTALAGPFMNLLLAFVARFLRFGALSLYALYPRTFLIYLFYFAEFYSFINIELAVFNLIPIPPLDGSRLLSVFLPTKAYFRLLRYERYISLAILLLIWVGVLNVPLMMLRNFVTGVLDLLPAYIFGF